MSVKKSTALLFAAFALVVLAVIYRFSSEPKNVSREKSGEVAEVVENINQNIEKKKQQTDVGTSSASNKVNESSNVDNSAVTERPENADHAEKTEVKPAIDLNKLVRKGAHVAEYAAFAVCFSMFFVLIDKMRYTYLIVVAIGLVYAVFDEAHQFFIPGRTPKFKDIFYDAMGLIIGTAIVYVLSAVIKSVKNRRKSV